MAAPSSIFPVSWLSFSALLHSAHAYIYVYIFLHPNSHTLGHPTSEQPAVRFHPWTTVLWVSWHAHRSTAAYCHSVSPSLPVPAGTFPPPRPTHTTCHRPPAAIARSRRSAAPA